MLRLKSIFLTAALSALPPFLVHFVRDRNERQVRAHVTDLTLSSEWQVSQN